MYIWTCECTFMCSHTYHIHVWYHIHTHIPCANIHTTHTNHELTSTSCAWKHMLHTHTLHTGNAHEHKYHRCRPTWNHPPQAHMQHMNVPCEQTCCAHTHPTCTPQHCVHTHYTCTPCTHRSLTQHLSPLYTHGHTHTHTATYTSDSRVYAEL